MNTLHLKYAVEVEKAGSITKAADRLRVNQPNLSKTIRELEETFGAEIFMRTSKGMVPTRKGVEFLACAKDVLAQVAKMENLFTDRSARSIYFSVSVPRASYISYAFTEFIKSVQPVKEIDVIYRETNSVTAIENVMDGESNIGIIRCRSDLDDYFTTLFREKRLRFELVREFEYLVLMSAQHPLAWGPAVDCPGLNEYIEITHGDSELALSPRYGCRRAGAGGRRGEIAIYERGSQFEILRRIPLTYMWVSPVPEDVLSTFSLVQKKALPKKPLHRDYLISRRGYRFSDEDRAFVEKLTSMAKLGEGAV
ncbi:MAG: LysR family transcriptional regulator [Desulfovibrio sp.]|jgi:DNA-binding transcriptional LysR family regulator|nr:LysR family transcriptional regulator [Desulfovibrio sp.]